MNVGPVSKCLSECLSSGSSLHPDARRIGDYIDSKFSDLDKAKLARMLLKTMSDGVPELARAYDALTEYVEDNGLLS